MTLRNFGIVLLAVALLGSSIGRANAFAPPPVVVAGTGVGAGIYVAGGFIGLVTALVAYDIWQKMNCQKNWDGTPMTARQMRRCH